MASTPDEDGASASHATAATGMHDLPAELLVDIAERIDPADLLNFRRMCREMKAASQDCFMKVFFEHRHHLLTHFSLKALLDITAEPHICSKIKSVHLYLPSTDLRASNHSKMHSAEPYYREMKHIRSRLTEERIAFTSGDYRGETLLYKALSLLATAGQAIDIGLKYARPSKQSPYPYGLETIEKVFGGFACDRGTNEEEFFPLGEMQKMLLGSIMASGLKVSSLVLPTPYAVVESSHRIDEVRFRQARHSFQNLQKLELGPHYPSTAAHFRKDYDYVKHIIATAYGSLTDLTIHLKHWHIKSSFLPANQLRMIVLHVPDDKCPLGLSGLTKMLARQRQSLRQFELHAPVLLSLFYLKEIFSYAARDLKLEVFEFHALDSESNCDDLFFKYEGNQIAAGIISNLLPVGY